MSEASPSASSSKTSGVWKTGTKGFNLMANAASSAAKTASINFSPVSGGRSSPSLYKVPDGGRVPSDHESSEAFSSRDLAESDNNTNEKSHSSKNNNNVFKKTYKSLKRGANKVNPLRMAFPKEGEEKTSMSQRLGTDEAEDAVLSSVERRSRTTKAGEDGFRPAVDGESPPLRVPTLGNAFTPALLAVAENGGIDRNRKSGAPSLKATTRKIMAIQRLERAAKMHQEASTRANISSNRQGHHRRARTLLDAIGNVNHDQDAPEDLLLGNGDDFRDFHKVFDADPNEVKEKNYEEIQNSSGAASGDERQHEQTPHESLPLLGGDSAGSRGTTDSELQWRARQLLVKSQFKRVRNFFNPVRIASKIGHWFIHSALMLAIPLCVTAWILFYYCGNPSPPEFLPGSATLSWWFNFTGRQLIVFELARVTQYFMIDLLVLHTRFVSRTLGPWVTIFCLQSKGWPFIVGSWGLWAMLLLQGSSKFDYHWFYFTGIEIYSSGNSGSYIINSEAYLRILLAMVITGVFTTLKRTLSTLYFGRRMFDAYKPRLEEILNDIILISEVADLSIESGNIASVIGVEKKKKTYEPPAEINTGEIKTVNRRGRIRWSSVKFESPDSRSGSQSGLLQEHDDISDTESQMTDDEVSLESSPYYDSNSSRIPLKALLDKWQEPVSKKDKTINATVNDILKFRQALTYMDLDFPFSEAFGRASTRNEMILSAEVVYNRLMHLSPEPDILSFSVFKILLLQEDGGEDKSKRKALRNLFRPDRNDNLPLLSFVQTCDNIYKKIRYFRASVGNASVIDQVLESIIDVVFYSTLGLAVLSMFNLNPWPLLVSVSTLLVTASFAVGPSCAKAIEGILLIVGRRPFDIGDRIIITDSPGAPIPTMASSWFVEDISLFSTTLRFAASNEIATLSNGSIASARITNCARSMNATVHTLLKFHISCHKGRVLQEYKDAVESFVQENPNIWDSILFFRLEDIDANNEVVTYRLAVRSRFTWQICNRVFQSQADLHKFCIALSFKLGINYDAPNPRTIMYYGGSLVDGGVQDYKAYVLQNDNINNGNEILTGLVAKDMPVSSMRGASQTSLDDEEKAPRFVNTAAESRAMEQQTQETNDDEMEGGSFVNQTNDANVGDERSMETEDPDARDVNQALLNLLHRAQEN